MHAPESVRETSDPDYKLLTVLLYQVAASRWYERLSLGYGRQPASLLPVLPCRGLAQAPHEECIESK